MPGDMEVTTATEREVMLAGIHRFNRREFFEAHDEWEKLWLLRRPGGRTFVQALIQLAAAYHNISRGKPRGAVRLFDSALQRLREFPAGWAGIDRSGLMASVERHRALISDARAIDPDELPQIVVPDELGVSVGDR